MLCYPVLPTNTDAFSVSTFPILLVQMKLVLLCRVGGGALRLATVRRSNRTYGFPVSGFHKGTLIAGCVYRLPIHELKKRKNWVTLLS
jgi:hypothetical protein